MSEKDSFLGFAIKGFIVVVVLMFVAGAFAAHTLIGLLSIAAFFFGYTIYNSFQQVYREDAKYKNDVESINKKQAQESNIIDFEEARNGRL